MPKSTLLLNMIEIIRTRPGITVSELSTALGRSERTVYRWIAEVSGDLHKLIVCNEGGYYIKHYGRSDVLDLEPEEALAIRLSLACSPFGAGSPLADHAGNAWLKIRRLLSPESIGQARDLSANHSVSITAHESNTPAFIMNMLNSAVKRQVRVIAKYASVSSGKVKEYTLDPYALVFRRHSWYLVGYSHTHGEIRQFKPSRFEQVFPTNEVFEVPDDFDVDDYFAYSWECFGGGEPTDVVVRFSPKVARIITESLRHATQQTSMEPDGHVIFKATVSGIEEIAIWILGFGKEAEVLEPLELRQLLSEHAAGMADTYSCRKNILKSSLVS